MPHETAPQDYQFTHPTQVFLDEYRGIARDIMRLNDPITDGFMRVSDMRRHISVVQKQHSRVYDYEDVGQVRVAKRLDVPRFGQKDTSIEVKKDKDAWIVAVDDQAISQDILATTNSTREFDSAFVLAFQQKLKRGMRDSLTKEKLLNGEEHSMAFFMNYFTFLTKDVIIIPLLQYVVMQESANIMQFIQGSLKTAFVFFTTNSFYNGLNTAFSLLARLEERIGILNEHPIVNYEEPFVRHSIVEHIMPPIPVDRLVRGVVYLRNHGDKLIKQTERLAQKK